MDELPPVVAHARIWAGLICDFSILYTSEERLVQYTILPLKVLHLFSESHRDTVNLLSCLVATFEGIIR